MSDILVILVSLLGIFGVYALLLCKDYNDKEINK